MEFFVNGMPTPIIRENMFYSDSDIAIWALSDLGEGIDLITYNTLQNVELEKINTEILIHGQKKPLKLKSHSPLFSS